GNAAQPEALRRIIGGGFQPPVVEAEALAGRILQVKLAIVATGQRFADQRPEALGIKVGIAVEEGRWIGHSADIGASGGFDTRFAVGIVGRPAAQNEAPVAIAAIDIALLVDLQPDARMAER